MVDGKPVVFDRGPLYLAMRGSMSMPGVFAPLEVDGQILGDGGLVNNLPVDLVKAMGADIVIAVNIGTPLMTREQLSSFIGVAEQSINILTEQNVRAQLALLTPRDVLIAPDLGDLSALDFTKGTRFVELGEQAARTAADRLRHYALSPEAWAAYRAGLRRAPTAAPPELTFAGIRGTDTTNPEVLQAQVDLAPGAKVDLPRAQADIAVLYGRGDFDRIDYRLTDEKGERRIEFDVSEKPWGPNFLQFGIGLASDIQGDSSFGVRVRHKRTWLNELGAQWTSDLNLGTVTNFDTEFYQPLTLSQTGFASAYGSIGTAPLDFFSDGEKVAEYSVLTERIGAALGYTAGTWGELRIGPELVHQRAYPTVALPGFPVAVTDRGASRRPRASTPRTTRSFRIAACASFANRVHRDPATGRRRPERDTRRVRHSPVDTVHRPRHAQPRRARRGHQCRRTRVTDFRLGGFLEISGLRIAELQGPYLGRARAVYLHRMGTLPVIGNTYYVGGSLEIGNVWQTRDAIVGGRHLQGGEPVPRRRHAFSGRSISRGVTRRAAHSSWYLFLGRP